MDYLIFVLTAGIVYAGNRALTYARISKYVEKANEMMKEAAKKDVFWNEENIREYVIGAYQAIYMAFSNHDLDTLNLYMSEELVERCQISFNWHNFKQERKMYRHVRVISLEFMAILDSDHDDEDAFWVRLEGGYRYKLVNLLGVKENKSVEKCEYWQFIRYHNRWILCDIKGEKEISL